MDNLNNCNYLLSNNSSWAYIVCSSEKDIDTIALNSQKFTGTVRIIRGKRCTTKKELFQEWAAALQFPYYFSENWDSFDECLSDLEWLPSDPYIFFVTQTNNILIDAEEELKVLINIFKDNAENFSSINNNQKENISFPLRLIFHCEPKNETFLLSRLKQAGLMELPKLSLEKS